MGIVYYGNYATYLEQGRTEWLRDIGFSYKWMEDNGIHLPVVELSVKYKAPARYDDVLTVDLRAHCASAQLCLNFFFSLVGFPFSPKKHERCKGANPFLGVVSDFAYLHLGYVLVRIKEFPTWRLTLCACVT